MKSKNPRRYQVITFSSDCNGVDERPEHPTITAARVAIREYTAEFANDGYTLDGAAIYDHDTARCTHLFGSFRLDFFSPDVRSRSTPRIYSDVSNA